tara:strand:+ start:1114 stop:1710 length:597 start_codon:yes stop_codon:yes gene_type:complete
MIPKKNLPKKNKPWIFKAKIDDFELLNDTLLECVEGLPSEGYSGVTKVDHRHNKNGKPIYFDLLFNAVCPHLKQLAIANRLKEPKRSDIEISMWFQQYQNNSFFNWHTHNQTYAMVYFCELPYGGQVTTEMVDVWQKELFTVDAEVGDMIVFPAFIPHRSPPNTTHERKTVFSANINFKNAMVDVELIDTGVDLFCKV